MIRTAGTGTGNIRTPPPSYAATAAAAFARSGGTQPTSSHPTKNLPTDNDFACHPVAIHVLEEYLQQTSNPKNGLVPTFMEVTHQLAYKAQTVVNEGDLDRICYAAIRTLPSAKREPGAMNITSIMHYRDKYRSKFIHPFGAMLAQIAHKYRLFEKLNKFYELISFAMDNRLSDINFFYPMLRFLNQNPQLRDRVLNYISCIEHASASQSTPLSPAAQCITTLLARSTTLPGNDHIYTAVGCSLLNDSDWNNLLKKFDPTDIRRLFTLLLNNCRQNSPKLASMLALKMSDYFMYLRKEMRDSILDEDLQELIASTNRVPAEDETLLARLNSAIGTPDFDNDPLFQQLHVPRTLDINTRRKIYNLRLLHIFKKNPVEDDDLDTATTLYEHILPGSTGADLTSHTTMMQILMKYGRHTEALAIAKNLASMATINENYYPAPQIATHKVIIQLLFELRRHQAITTINTRFIAQTAKIPNTPQIEELKKFLKITLQSIQHQKKQEEEAAALEGLVSATVNE